MKRFAMQAAVTSAAAVVLVFGAATITHAQDQKPEEKPPAQEQKKDVKPATPPKEARPEHQNQKPKPNQAKDNQPAQQDSRRAQEESKQQQKVQSKQGQQRSKQSQDNAKRAQKDDAKRAQGNARIAQTEQPREQQPRTASAGQADHGRIPDDKFRAHFGREHHFHVGHPVIVDNRPRFQYSGYWFEFADAWPAGWSYDDDCYIDYVDDGYYLFDPVHPGIRIAVTIIG